MRLVPFLPSLLCVVHRICQNIVVLAILFCHFWWVYLFSMSSTVQYSSGSLRILLLLVSYFSLEVPVGLWLIRGKPYVRKGIIEQSIPKIVMIKPCASMKMKICIGFKLGDNIFHSNASKLISHAYSLKLVLACACLMHGPRSNGQCSACSLKKPWLFLPFQLQVGSLVRLE